MKAAVRLYVSSLDYYLDKLTRSQAGSTVYYKDFSIFTTTRTCFQLSANLWNIIQCSETFCDRWSF